MEWLLSKGFTKEEFGKRRQRLVATIGREAHALLQGTPRSPDMDAGIAQSKQFFYLSGIEIERSYVLIAGETGESTLFVPLDQVGESHHKSGTLSEEDLPTFGSLSGFDRVLPVDRLKGELESVSILFVPHQPAEHSKQTRGTLQHAARLRAQDEWELGETREERLISLIKKRFPNITVNDLSPILDDMRLIKSDAEIAVMREAARITCILINECMKATEPGMPLDKLSAIGKYVYQLYGQCSEGYDYLVTPSTEDSDALVDGDLVLMDCGPDFRHYTTDIARLWPVNGKYDEWQRHTYGFIVDYHKTMIAHLRPGAIAQQVYDDTAAEMLKRYKDDAVATSMIHNMMERGVRYLNHSVGMSVHDNVKAWHDDPLKPGMVIVVDPMIWLENVPHTYVRVEDTVVITENGCERLTADTPLELDDVEKLMAQPSQFPM
jgi:Xaa-Pro aminopeptidase